MYVYGIQEAKKLIVRMLLKVMTVAWEGSHTVINLLSAFFYLNLALLGIILVSSASTVTKDASLHRQHLQYTECTSRQQYRTFNAHFLFHPFQFFHQKRKTRQYFLVTKCTGVQSNNNDRYKEVLKSKVSLNTQ